MIIPKGKHRYIAYFMFAEEQKRENLFKYFVRVRDLKEFAKSSKAVYYDYKKNILSYQ